MTKGRGAASAAAALSSSAAKREKKGRCKFLSTPEGCRNGAACKFSHGTAASEAGGQRRGEKPPKARRQPNDESKPKGKAKRQPNGESKSKPKAKQQPKRHSEQPADELRTEKRSAGPPPRASAPSSSPQADPELEPPLPSLPDLLRHLGALREISSAVPADRAPRQKLKGAKGKGSESKKKNLHAAARAPSAEDWVGLVEEALEAARRVGEEAAALRDERDDAARELERRKRGDEARNGGSAAARARRPSNAHPGARRYGADEFERREVQIGEEEEEEEGEEESPRRDGYDDGPLPLLPFLLSSVPASLLTVSHEAYAAYLRDLGDDLDSVSALVEAVGEDGYLRTVLASGGIADGRVDEFRDAVVGVTRMAAPVAMGSGRDIFPPVSSVPAAADAAANAGVRSARGGWQCEACTFVHADHFCPACAMRGTPRSVEMPAHLPQPEAVRSTVGEVGNNSSAIMAQEEAMEELRRRQEAVRRREEEEEAERRAAEEAKWRAEEEARKKAAKEKAAAEAKARAKLKVQRRREEAEREAREEAELRAAEERRRREILAEKRAALERHEALQKEKEEERERECRQASAKLGVSGKLSASAASSRLGAANEVGTTSAAEEEHLVPSTRNDNNKKCGPPCAVEKKPNRKVSSAPARSAKKTTSMDSSSILLYPTRREADAGDAKKISPIFNMLRDPSALTRARDILVLETDIARLKGEEVDIREQIGACERQIGKIEEGFTRMASEKKTQKQWQEEASKQKKERLDALDKRFEKDKTTREEKREAELYKKRPDEVEAAARGKRKQVHNKYLAPLEAMERDLHAEKVKIKRDRDEQLGVFRLESAARSRRETIAAAEKKQTDNLAKIKKERTNALKRIDTKLKGAIEKIDKKKEGSLRKIQRRKEDKLAAIENKRADAIAQIKDRLSKELEAADISTTIGSRYFESKEKREKRDEIEKEAKESREAVEKKCKEERNDAEKRSKESADPFIRQAEEERKAAKETAEKERDAVEKMTTDRQEATKKETSDKKEAAEKEAREVRAAVEQHVCEMKEIIEQDYQTKMGEYEVKRAKKLKEVRRKREEIQPKVKEAMDSIQAEFESEMAEVRAYRTSVMAAFGVNEADHQDKYRRDVESIQLSTHEFLAKVQMSEERREADRVKDIALQRNKIGLLEQDMIAKRNEIDEARAKIAGVKGNGQVEDAVFDIDTRDHFGNNPLIICAQRNDIATAKVCLNLGASPNERNNDGLTAMAFAAYFKNTELIDLLAQNGASDSKQPFDDLMNMKARALSPHEIDWDTQLRISEQAMIPPDTFLASAEDLDKDEDSRMPTLSKEEQESHDFSCFETRLLNPESTRNFRRVIFIEKSVYAWLVDADRGAKERTQFFSLLHNLFPANSKRIVCHRRALVGVHPQFEVLCAALEPGRITAKSTVVHFTPFVSSEVHGVADIGVLLWAISSESKASYVKALIEQSEFKRNKVNDEKERFLPHTDFTLPLGKDMHLLDLKSTSSWKSSPMTLFTVGVDSGDFARMEANDVDFTPKTRTLESERILRNQLFRRSESELRENEEILDDSRKDLSTNLFGGAGTGKTMLLIQKVASECAPHRRILAITRLPRLVTFIKSGVKAQKGISVGVDYLTYEELLTYLARRCNPSNSADKHTFSVFSEIHFSETTGTGVSAGVSFQQSFIDGHLTAKERSTMKKSSIEPLSLWTAIRVIKSHASVAHKKRPLDRQEYMSLPKIFGFDASQRKVAYDLYEKYQEWMTGTKRFLWDEADRVLYCLKFGEKVFSDDKFVSWEERAFKWGEEGMVGPDGMPQGPFYHFCFADEAQDFSDLDIALFIRMSSGVRSVFLGADPAQSVELGIRMRDGGVNDVFHSCLPTGKGVQVKDVLQDIRLKTNHRTHQQNLDLSLAIRRVLTRSFCVPGTDENAIAKGPIPEGLLLKKLADLGSEHIFKGANVVFIVPDENLSELRALFLDLGMKNDIFGVREAKGLEFDNCALLGFFSYFERRGSAREWQNCLRWLFSKTGIKVTESSESINSVRLQPCDYLLAHPEIEDQAMMLYTALTRARQHLYIIEDEESGKRERRGKAGLGDFAFRHLQQLHIMKTVCVIDAGETEMTPQEHNARGVLLVTKAIALSNNGADTIEVVEKFEEAADRFRPDKGCDSSLLHQCLKHRDAVVEKRELIQELKTEFFSMSSGKYLLAGRFSQILSFETKAAKFVRRYIDDPFTIDEVRQLGAMMEDVFFDSAYWIHFEEVCDKIRQCCT